MPSIQNLVPDLANGSIIGLAGRPDTRFTTNHAPVSETCRVKYLYANAKFSLSPSNRLVCETANSIDINGSYLHFEDDFSTVTKIDILRPIVMSGRFSGCAYKVFRHGGIITCAHVARPAGREQEAIVGLMDSYAGQKGWEELQHISTMGYIGVNGCREVAIISQLRAGNLDTILLAVDNAGLIVNTARTTTRL
jgi:hypothetical protein